MPLQISNKDIRKVKTDVIVMPAAHFLSDFDHHAPEPERAEPADPRTGEAIITKSCDLDNCRYLIHTGVPVYIDGSHDEEKILASCYEKCLKLAVEKEAESIAFPLLGSAFPQGRAFRIANEVITAFLSEQEMQVLLLIADRGSFDTADQLHSDIHDYLERNLQPEIEYYAPMMACSTAEKHSKPHAEYQQNIVFEPDESFSECLLRMIDEKGLKDPDVYKKANIDRKHFNHIINTKDYRPKKETAIALAIGMGLDLKETAILLERAGFVLSRSSKFDLIIRYCLEHRIKDIYRINEILFAEDQKTLGC